MAQRSWLVRRLIPGRAWAPRVMRAARRVPEGECGVVSAAACAASMAVPRARGEVDRARRVAVLRGCASRERRSTGPAPHAVTTGGARHRAPRRKHGHRSGPFTHLRHVGSDELELAVEQRHLARVAAGPGTALLECQIAAAHRSDSFGRRHPPERFEPRCPLGGCAREEFGEGAGTHGWLTKVAGSAGPPGGGPAGVPVTPRLALRSPRPTEGRPGTRLPDDADRGAVGAVVGDPVAVVEAAVDGDQPAL
jgi:hypothetical protein